MIIYLDKMIKKLKFEKDDDENTPRESLRIFLVSWRDRMLVHEKCMLMESCINWYYLVRNVL